MTTYTRTNPPPPGRYVLTDDIVNLYFDRRANSGIGTALTFHAGSAVHVKHRQPDGPPEIKPPLAVDLRFPGLRGASMTIPDSKVGWGEAAPGWAQTRHEKAKAKIQVAFYKALYASLKPTDPTLGYVLGTFSMERCAEDVLAVLLDRGVIDLNHIRLVCGFIDEADGVSEGRTYTERGERHDLWR